METKKTKAKEWFEEELIYIKSVDKDNPGNHFCNDSELFKGYVILQAIHAEENGFKEIADEMRNYIK